MKKYECVTLKGNTLIASIDFNEKFQKLLDEYSNKGWTLHSFHFGSSNVCVIVFERNE